MNMYTKHHLYTLSVIQFLFVNYTSVKLGKRELVLDHSCEGKHKPKELFTDVILREVRRAEDP